MRTWSRSLYTMGKTEIERLKMGKVKLLVWRNISLVVTRNYSWTR